MRIKNTLAALAVLIAGVSSGAMLDNGFTYSTSPDFKVGEWSTQFNAMKAMADEEGIPLVVFWANPGCSQCGKLEAAFANNAAVANAWMKKRGYLFAFGYGTSTKDESACKSFARHASGEFPYCAIYWKGVVSPQKKFVGRDGKMLAKTGDLLHQFMNSCDQFLGAYKPPVVYAGGYFTQTNYPYASLQAEATTTFVDVEIVRTATIATNQVLKLVYKGKTASKTLDWAENELTKSYRLADFNGEYFVEGADVTLQLWGKDEDDKDAVMSTVKIACVTPENSTGNPDFKGCSSFGRWTMDLNAAKEKTHGTGGKAYTLVCVQGSLWCPDCGRVEKNFLGVKDAGGNNRFAAWAASKNVALVTVDIPNYSSASPEAASPCLLKKDAYLTNPESAPEKAMHSGLGYLTRKMISDADAATVLARNHDLVSKMTYEGGFNRPEERDYKNRLYRCGAPVFVLLDKEGKVRAELVRLAEDSSMSASDFGNIIKRFDEMLDICDDNATEIENNYASKTGSIKSFKANGGSDTARLCNADMYDTFLLDIGGNARQQVVVKGSGTAGVDYDADCEVTVEFQKLDAAGKAVTLGKAATGTLGKGVTNTVDFSGAGEYYVQVRGWGADRAAGYKSDAFKLTSAKDGHFQNFVITGATLLMPQEDKATAFAPEGSDKVQIVLKRNDESGEPIIYHITGLKSCNALEEISGHPGFYTATADGQAEATLTAVGGEITYQIWRSGTVGFVATELKVVESVCDLSGEPLAIRVGRTDGKSGAVRMTVTLDRAASTFDKVEQKRYWLCKGGDVEQKADSVELTWADGDQANKVVSLYIDDDLFYDGNGTVVLKAVTDGGDAGDVEIAAGRDVFTLTVTEDEKRDPGRAFFTRTDPDFVRKGTVYTRASEAVTIWARRIEHYDGLIAGVLKSSVAGTAFASDNPRDLDDIENVLDPADIPSKYKGAKVLYWSSREGGEKPVKVTGIPAGKTAKITFTPVNMKGISASNTVTVVSIADDAPGFDALQYDFSFVRCVGSSANAPLDQTPGRLDPAADAKTISFTKLAGTLPSGLKVAYDADEKAMLITGMPTAKAGVYTPAYQVREKRDGKWVSGMTATLRITIVDVTAKGADGADPLNPACAKSRTFKNIPVYDEANRRLAGTIQVTIPSTGRLSAKFAGFACDEALKAKALTVSFSSKSWSGCDPSTYALQAELSSKSAGWGLTVVAEANGSVALQLNNPDGDAFFAVTDGKLWSKANPATAWKGYYTVAIKQDVSSVREDPVGVAPTGYGYLTLKMNTTSAANSGTFTIAGMLPDGTKFSGSSVLSATENPVLARLPVFKASSRDVVSAVAEINANAMASEDRRCVNSPEACKGFWSHVEKTGYHTSAFALYGSYYDSTEDLGGCCEEFYQTDKLNFYLDENYLGGAADLPTIKVGKNKSGKNAITLEGENPAALKLTFTLSTGVVTGTFKDDLSGKRLSYAGVVINGWGEDCGCGNYDIYLPFVSGSFLFKVGKMASGGEMTINK